MFETVFNNWIQNSQALALLKAAVRVSSLSYQSIGHWRARTATVPCSGQTIGLSQALILDSFKSFRLESGVLDVVV